VFLAKLSLRRNKHISGALRLRRVFYTAAGRVGEGILLAALLAIAGSADENDDAMGVMQQSGFDSARARAQRAYTGDSAEPGAILAYAATLSNVAIARALYKKIVARKTSPDSVRAAAYYRLACIAYMAGNYGKAASLCASARRLSDKPQYSRLSARGVLQVRGDSVEKTPVSPSSLAKAGRPREGLDTGLESKKRPDTVETHGSAAGRYYLQVGAFAAVENAQGLKNELSRRFSKVSVTTGASGGRQVFRVRVGAFVSKETAQAFGDSALVKKGMTFRVVEE